MASAIAVERVAKTYGKDVVALRDVSFSIDSGEIVGILGPNGAGKSTLLRTLMTLTRPDGGKASVLGRDVLADPAGVRRDVGFVPQASGFEEFATPASSLLLLARLYHVPAAEREGRIAELLDTFDLKEVAGRKVRDLSGGTRRRLDLAGALIHRPKLLIMDEPTVGLDPAAREEMWRSVERLVDQTGLPVLFTTHYLDEADRHSDRVIIIDRGIVVSEGTPDALKAALGGDSISVRLAEPPAADAVARIAAHLGAGTEPAVDERTIHFASREARSDVWRILDAVNAEGLTIESTEISRPTLDEVYLRATGRSFAQSDNAQAEAPRRGRGLGRWGGPR